MKAKFAAIILAIFVFALSMQNAYQGGAVCVEQTGHATVKQLSQFNPVTRDEGLQSPVFSGIAQSCQQPVQWFTLLVQKLTSKRESFIPRFYTSGRFTAISISPPIYIAIRVLLI